MTTQEINRILLTVKASKTHIDCVTKGETYNVVSVSKNGYEIFPDVYGYRSIVHKSYFETPLPAATKLAEILKNKEQ